jgi:hypothetical protein
MSKKIDVTDNRVDLCGVTIQAPEGHVLFAWESTKGSVGIIFLEKVQARELAHKLLRLTGGGK